MLAVIAKTWATAKPKVFDGDETSLTADAIAKTTKQLEHCAVKLGTFGSQMDKKEDFDLLEKPLQEFQKSYVILLGTLTAMGGGKEAGRSLRKEIIDFGNQAAAAYSSVEECICKKDLEEIKTLPRKVGDLLDVLKKWSKVPRQNHTAVKKRLVIKIRELRDAQRELKEELDEKPVGADEEKNEDENEDEDNALGMQATVDVIESLENILKLSIHAIKDDKVVEPAAQEAFLDVVSKITLCTDELSCGFQSFDDDMFDELMGDDDDEGDFEDDEMNRTKDRAEIVASADRLLQLVRGEFKEFAEVIKLENNSENFGKLDERLNRLREAVY